MTHVARCLPLSFAALLAVAAPALGGPAEARARWKEAQAAKNEPYPDRVKLLRLVRVEAGASDPIVARAAAAEARVLRAADRPEGAAAADALAAGFGPLREPDRLSRALSAARELLDDGDVVGGEVLLADVLDHGGEAAPLETGPALVLLAHVADELGDAAELERLVRRSADLVPRLYDDRLALLDLLGMSKLSAGDVPAARRVLADQKRIYDEAKKNGPAAERVAAKAWLSLTLPKRLTGG